MATIKRTIGGDRIGSGKKMTATMHGYGKSTHNLNKTITYDQAPGVIYPIDVKPMLVGDTKKIDLNELIRTLPTTGPAFVKFKWQAHVFWCPIRLYNAQLHNSRLDIGMHLEQVMFPKVELHGDTESQWGVGQFNPSSWAHYMGIAGTGRPKTGVTDLKARFQAMTMLAYWDIYKNFYANKQEGVGKVIAQETIVSEEQLNIGSVYGSSGTKTNNFVSTSTKDLLVLTTTATGSTPTAEWVAGSSTGRVTIPINGSLQIQGQNLDPEKIYLWAQIGTSTGTGPTKVTLAQMMRSPNFIIITNNSANIEIEASGAGSGIGNTNATVSGKDTNCAVWIEVEEGTSRNIEIQTFELTNIDKMRDTILQQPISSQLIIGPGTATGKQAAIGAEWIQPYATAVGTTLNKTPNQAYMNGLGLRTYLNDRFNVWLDTEWIDGTDGISSRTAIDTSSGSFTMDSLNLSQKVYNLLNRIGSAGGTYVDYLESAFGLEISRGCEIPQFKGGASTEIVFNEVVSMADAQGADGSDQPLGSLAGRGNTMNHKDGVITITAPEHGFVIICASMVPIVAYSQGNKWFNRWDNLRELHMPEMDGIGYQELITDELVASDTIRDTNGNPVNGGTVGTYNSVGKQPAWIEYMTDQNETHGEFAVGGALDWMVANRNYGTDATGALNDATTYVDPQKFTYMFASSELPDTQWAWVQVAQRDKTKRIMSAKLMPTM